MFSTLRARYRHIRRYNEVLRILVKYGFEDFVAYVDDHKRFSFFRKLIPQRVYEHSRTLTKWEKMRLVCEELGPTFVKFGQLLSNRPDVLPAALITELEKLQDSVPPEKAEVAIALIERELGKSVRELFSSFSHEAFASASMAQVHRATLKTGEEIVIKVQRPGIDATIASDMRVMYYLADMFSKRIPSLKSFDPVGLVSSFEKAITLELDFIHESVNIQRFRNNFEKDKKEHEHISAPQIYPAITTSRVLAMSFIKGIKISDCNRLDEAGYDRGLLAKRLTDSYFRQLFVHGFFHGDPHPGNILVLPGNNIAYLDFGAMGTIVRKDLEAIAGLFMAIHANDVRRVIRSILQLSDTSVVENYRELESDVGEFLQSYNYRSIHQNELSTAMLELKDLIVKHELKVPTHFFTLIRATISIEGVIRQLDPNLDVLKEMKPYVIRMAAKHYNPIQFARRVFNAVYELGMYMEDFPRDLKNAMRRINAGEMKVDLRHKGIDPMVHTINRISKQIISAVLIAGLVIGGAQLLIHKVPPLWGDDSVFGLLCFLLALLLGWGMVKDLRKGDHDDWSGWKNK